MKRQACARRIGVCVAVGCASVLHTMPGHADWETIPDITLEAETNDNPSLDAGVTTIDSASRVLADVALQLRKSEPRGELTFVPRVRRDAYMDEEARPLESTDVFLRSSGENRGQTVRIGYAADLARERILGVEFLETLDPVGDDPSAIATNQVGANERRTRVGISPYVDITLNSRGSMRLDGHLVDIDYAGGATAGRTDFFERAIGGEYRRELDQRGALGVRVFATGYEATVNNNTTDTRGIELNYSRVVTELWSWNIGGGTQRSDFALSSAGRRIRGTDDTAIFHLGLRKRTEQSSMRAELRRQMSPDAAGFVAPRDELSIAWQRMLSARVNGRMALRAYDAEGVPTVPGSDRRYGRAELDVEWQFNPAWWLIAGYAHSTARWGESINDDTADSNAITVGIRYRGRSQAAEAGR